MGPSRSAWATCCPGRLRWASVCLACDDPVVMNAAAATTAVVSREMTDRLALGEMGDLRGFGRVPVMQTAPNNGMSRNGDQQQQCRNQLQHVGSLRKIDDGLRHILNKDVFLREVNRKPVVSGRFA